MFKIETIVAIPYNNHLVQVELAYLPITFSEEVRLTCKNTVNGSWILNIICEIISP